jgi:histidine triad (HIT) family protein
MKDTNCIFCKLANGDIPTNSIYEDEDFRVILDASPATKGHALILPKNHYANIYEIDSEVLGKAVKLAQKVITHETKVLDCEGYNLVQNNGEVAGQTVFHFHMHLIPRYASDEDKDVIAWNHKDYSDDEMKKICEEMKFTEM